ncbi:MAG: acyltransferase [Microthrixaceae bacterium]|nr:acyltransferase [Microthrixaceae bacterium]
MTDTTVRVVRARSRARAQQESARAAGPPRLGHRPGLDALRGVAVMSIVAYHADPGWFSLAPGSLDVFFVLSTFLVTTVLLDSLSRRGGPQGRRFFTRRARRLAAGLAVMVATVLALVAVGVYKSPETTRTAVGAVLLHANVAQFSGDYFAAFAERNPLEHTWSLSVEEHFYLATFLVVLVLWWATRRNLRRTRIGLLVVAAGVAVGSVLSARHLLDGGATANRMYMGTDTRAVAAAVGVAVAAALWGRWDLKRSDGTDGFASRIVSWSAWTLFIGIIVAALARWYPTLEWFASGGWFVSALAGALLVVAAGRATTAGRVSGNAAFQWAGRRSYGIYLWHLPLLVLLAELGTWGIAAALVGTFVAAEASHRFVERPFRADTPGGGVLPDRLFVPGVVAVCIAVALVAWAVPEPERPAWALEADGSDQVAAEAPPAPPTTLPPEPLDVFVWGDVAASVVGPELAEDDRFEVTTEAHLECVERASCEAVDPPVPPPGTDVVVIAITDIKAFDPPITNVLDIMGQIARTRATYDAWSATIGDVPIALAMPPEARRGVDSALHFRQFTAEDPKNLVLGAEPAEWPDALYESYGESVEDAPRKVLVVGDSVAFSLATEFRPDGTVVWDQSRHGCDPSPGDRVAARTGRDRTPPVCDWRTDWARAIQEWDPEVVVWHTGTWSTYDRIIDGQTYTVGTPEWHDMERDVHAEAMQILASGGAEVIVAVVAPAWETAAGKPLETTPEESARRMPELLSAVQEAAEQVPGVTVVDASEAICDPDCNRPELRPDGVHYSAEGAQVVSAWLAPLVVPD